MGKANDVGLTFGETGFVYLSVFIVYLLVHSVVWNFTYPAPPPAIIAIHFATFAATSFAISAILAKKDLDKWLVGGYRKLKYLIRQNNKSLLHERFPNIIDWKDGDKIEITFYEEDDPSKVFKERRHFYSISGPKSIIIVENTFNNTYYHEISTDRIIEIENVDYNRRFREQKSKRIKEKAENITEYEEYLQAKEEALEEVRDSFKFRTN